MRQNILLRCYWEWMKFSSHLFPVTFYKWRKERRLTCMKLSSAITPLNRNAEVKESMIWTWTPEVTLTPILRELRVSGTTITAEAAAVAMEVTVTTASLQPGPGPWRRGWWAASGAWTWCGRWRTSWWCWPGAGTGAAPASSPSTRTRGGREPSPRTTSGCWTTCSGCRGRSTVSTVNNRPFMLTGLCSLDQDWLLLVLCQAQQCTTSWQLSN